MRERNREGWRAGESESESESELVRTMLLVERLGHRVRVPQRARSEHTPEMGRCWREKACPQHQPGTGTCGALCRSGFVVYTCTSCARGDERHRHARRWARERDVRGGVVQSAEVDGARV